MDERLHALSDLGVRYPIMQAGMPGAGNVRLAAAVARAGGIGTLGLQDLSTWEQSLSLLRQQAVGHPFNANLLLPYTRKGHVEAVLRQHCPIVTLFWGAAKPYLRQLQPAGCFVFQQVGSLSEAERALEAGVNGLIVQGCEAGGHVRGEEPLVDLLPAVRDLAGEVPCFAAGGLYGAGEVAKALALGADGVSTGSRFLMTRESGAHPAYQQRLVDATETIRTTLFGLGWATPHRVVPNAATERWCDARGDVPGWLDAINRAFGFTRRLLPFKAEPAMSQRAHRPLFTNAVMDDSLPASLTDSCALYAGEAVAALESVLTVDEVMAELKAAFQAPAC
ncbi:NAD(P)H-dependent flavin oxidoreductase [Marinobacter xestospongiae]|uniref:NAD(P)H-dependent flavin oxidoreductase n=1 Tax=Marinobacter xestospongiae TaxID=994319 RepID=UPI002006D6E1|nr:nitronate monooxygenase [Marinobacter xestospongiae]MCK7568979.1 nitronate monooxygenase [Marinobacter xestospongiae]